MAIRELKEHAALEGQVPVDLVEAPRIVAAPADPWLNAALQPQLQA
jgi:hypothetical protein